MATVRLVKANAYGNDFLLALDDGSVADPPGFTRAVCARHLGVGADGLIALVRGSAASVGMAMWNADGSVGAMCGNGLRCLAVFARERGHADDDAFAVETAAGLREVAIERDRRGAVSQVRADLGAVRVERDAIEIAVEGRRLRFHRGSAGNPHAVTFLDCDPEEFPVEAVGAALQSNPAFPGGVNAEFVEVQQDGSLLQRTFERGSGETLACGTGAAAAALCALQNGLVTGSEVLVRLRGGALRVRPGERSLVIVGPARTVFRGEIDVPSQY